MGTKTTYVLLTLRHNYGIINLLRRAHYEKSIYITADSGNLFADRKHHKSVEFNYRDPVWIIRVHGSSSACFGCIVLYCFC